MRWREIRGDDQVFERQVYTKQGVSLADEKLATAVAGLDREQGYGPRSANILCNTIFAIAALGAIGWAVQWYKDSPEFPDHLAAKVTQVKTDFQSGVASLFPEESFISYPKDINGKFLNTFYGELKFPKSGLSELACREMFGSEIGKDVFQTANNMGIFHFPLSSESSLLDANQQLYVRIKVPFGYTLSHFAEMSGASVERLTFINNLKNPNKIGGLEAIWIPVKPVVDGTKESSDRINHSL